MSLRNSVTGVIAGTDQDPVTCWTACGKVDDDSGFLLMAWWPSSVKEQIKLLLTMFM